MEEELKGLTKPPAGNSLHLKLLRALIVRGTTTLRPTITKKGIRYYKAERRVKNIPPKEIPKLLERLSREGKIKAELFDRVIACSECGCPKVTPKFACPKCGSEAIETIELYEHITCGYMDSKEAFLTTGTLTCPKCGTELSEDDPKFNMIGTCYQCNDCGNRFEKPETVFICQNCKKKLTFSNAKYLKIYSYTIPEQTVREFGKEIPILEFIQEKLNKKGFVIHCDGEVEGISGLMHPFSIVARKDDFLVVVDVVSSATKDEMLAIIGKRADVPADKFIVISVANGPTKILRRIKGVDFFNGSDVTKFKKRFKKYFQQHF